MAMVGILSDTIHVAVGGLTSYEKKVMRALEQRPQEPDQINRIPALDGLRGAAILAVLLYHYGRGLESSSAIVKALARTCGFGWSGVDLFFVLSGFLITGILYDTRHDPHYYKNFYARRSLRIFPIYYLLVAIFLVLTPLLHIPWRPAHISFLFYVGYPASLLLPGLAEVSPLVRITHLWSLCVEEQFYAIWPSLIAKLETKRVIYRTCGILVGTALFLRILVRLTGINSAWAYTFLPCRMDSIGVGGALAMLTRGPKRAAAVRWAPLSFLVGALSVAVIVLIRRTADHTDPIFYTVGFTAVAVMYGGLLGSTLAVRSFPGRVFSLPTLRMFGRYSYGLYLYHFPLTELFDPTKAYFIAITHSVVLGRILYLTFVMVANLMIAAVSFHFIETPIMRLKSHFRPARPTRPLT
jgi:peptidoglycan/LPS O-acetylase OafA/YrhL